MVWLLNVKLGAEQSTYLAKLEIENWSAAYRAHCRSTPCALPAAYHARTGPHHTARTPQHTARIAQPIMRISRSTSCAPPQVPCACAHSSAQLAHGQMRIPPS